MLLFIGKKKTSLKTFLVMGLSSNRCGIITRENKKFLMRTIKRRERIP